MNPWVESFLVLLLSLLGVVLGILSSKLPGKAWVTGYVVPIILIFAVGAAYWNRHLEFSFPFSVLIKGRTEFVLWGFLGTMVLVTPLSRLTSRRLQLFVIAFAVFVVGRYSLWPFAAPAFNRDHLTTLTTYIDRDGVCLQSTSYTCGPAASVTVLRQLGIEADEGPLAILAHTSQGLGTPPDVLAQVLQDNYSKQGISAKYRAFNSIADLPGSGYVLAVLKLTFLVDHYVAVLKVTDKEVWAGDPISGLVKMSHEEFNERWRKVGIAITTEAKSK